MRIARISFSNSAGPFRALYTSLTIRHHHPVPSTSASALASSYPLLSPAINIIIIIIIMILQRALACLITDDISQSSLKPWQSKGRSDHIHAYARVYAFCHVLIYDNVGNGISELLKVKLLGDMPPDPLIAGTTDRQE